MQLQLYTNVLRAVKTNKVLEKYAAHTGDPEALAAKAQLAQTVLTALKTAGAASAAGAASKLWANPLAKGLAIGTGATVPAAIGGSYLIDRAGEQAKETSADMRNKALQTAAGVAGIGAGLYGLHRLTQPTQADTVQQVMWERDSESGKPVAVRGVMHKKSSATETPEELLQKLAAVGYLDEFLDAQEKNASGLARQDIAECRLLNAEHGLDILGQLLDD